MNPDNGWDSFLKDELQDEESRRIYERNIALLRREREADADIAAGRVERFESAEDFLADLDDAT